MNNWIITVIISLLCLFLGLILGAKDLLPKDFFDINIYHVFNIVFSVVIGFFAAYYLNQKNSKKSKKIEYIIKLCNELDLILDEKSALISEYLCDYSEDVKQKNILLFFKTISTKIALIKSVKVQESKNGAEYISKLCDEYRDTITGNEWGRRTTCDDVFVEKFKKDISSCRGTLQKIIADCLNN